MDRDKSGAASSLTNETLRCLKIDQYAWDLSHSYTFEYPYEFRSISRLSRLKMDPTDI